MGGLFFEFERVSRPSRSAQALVEKKQSEDRHRKQMRRAQMEARIQRNMAQAVKMEEKRKEHFWEKKAHHEALRHDLGVLWCLHAIDATRLHQTRPWVVCFRF